MAETKTKWTGASVSDYLAERGNDEQRADCRKLMALMKKVTGKPAKMWGPSIVGFGKYKYTYDSGHSGEAPEAGFAIRGRDLVVYIWAEDATQRALLSRLGKHKIGKSCLYFRRLDDLDQPVLEKLVSNSVAEVRRKYG